MVTNLDWAEFASQPLEWHRNENVSARNYPFVIKTRLTRYRNFTGYPFVVSTPPQVCETLADKALIYFSKAGGYSIHRLVDCAPSVIRLLREQHFLPERAVAFPGKGGSKYLLMGEKKDQWALVNEVEHLTYSRVFAHFLSQDEFATFIRSPQNEIEQGLSEHQNLWSFSKAYGFLTSNPERLGVVPEIEMLVHLPALCLSRKILQARNLMTALGVILLPVYAVGENQGESALFLIRSRSGAGKSFSTVYPDFLNRLLPLLDWEKNLQTRCFEIAQGKLELRIKNSLQHLKQAKSLSLPELLAHSSNLRLGAYLNMVPAEWSEKAESWRVVTGSGHLGVIANSILSKEEEDKSRANVVRLSLEASGI